MKKFRQSDVDFMLLMLRQEISHNIPSGEIVLGEQNVKAYREGYCKGYTRASMYLMEIFEGCLK